MNALMNFGIVRCAIILLSFANLVLAASAVKIGGYSMFIGLLNPENLALLAGCVMLVLLTVYYVVKVIWRDKYLNFDSSSPRSKLVAFAIMFITGFSALFLFKIAGSLASVAEMAFECSIVFLMGSYMFVVAAISALFISDFTIIMTRPNSQ